jgi:hypothetical protein
VEILFQHLTSLVGSGSPELRQFGNDGLDDFFRPQLAYTADEPKLTYLIRRLLGTIGCGYPGDGIL